MRLSDNRRWYHYPFWRSGPFARGAMAAARVVGGASLAMCRLPLFDGLEIPRGHVVIVAHPAHGAPVAVARTHGDELSSLDGRDWNRLNGRAASNSELRSRYQVASGRDIGKRRARIPVAYLTERSDWGKEQDEQEWAHDMGGRFEFRF